MINNAMISVQMPSYFNAETITYECIPGYSQQDVREINCTCNVSNAENWSCTIPVDDFEDECKKG